jgi:hypothetical protein
MDFLKYNISTDTYSKSGKVTTARYLNGWSVVNLGANPVQVNGDTLTTGQSKSVGGNAGEIYIGLIRLDFGTGALIDNNAVVTQKFYEDGNQYDSPPKRNF